MTPGRMPAAAAASAAPDTGVEPGRPGSTQAALEAVLARIWRNALRRGEVGAEDDFFDLGGQSLIAARIIVIDLVSEGIFIRAAPASRTS